MGSAFDDATDAFGLAKMTGRISEVGRSGMAGLALVG